jgi:hypothetical protein
MVFRELFREPILLTDYLNNRFCQCLEFFRGRAGIPLSEQLQFSLIQAEDSTKILSPSSIQPYLFNNLVSKTSCFVFLMKALTGGIFCGITDQRPYTTDFSGGRVVAASISNDMLMKFSDKSAKDRDHVKFVSSMKKIP